MHFKFETAQHNRPALRDAKQGQVQFHLVLPPVPSDELSDEALDAVSGGAHCRSIVQIGCWDQKMGG